MRPSQRASWIGASPLAGRWGRLACGLPRCRASVGLVLGGAEAWLGTMGRSRAGTSRGQRLASSGAGYWGSEPAFCSALFSTEASCDNGAAGLGVGRLPNRSARRRAGAPCVPVPSADRAYCTLYPRLCRMAGGRSHHPARLGAPARDFSHVHTWRRASKPARDAPDPTLASRRRLACSSCPPCLLLHCADCLAMQRMYKCTCRWTSVHTVESCT